jgi:hypothetical protein
VLLTTPLAAPAPASSNTAAHTADAVPFDSARWNFDAAEHRVEQHLGRTSLILQDGVARLDDVAFTDGIIEFDIAFGPERGFAGTFWRMQDAGNYEDFYLRPHQSGNPDANQYTPVFNGVSAWQLYHGEGYAAPVAYRFNEWMHVKIVVSGDRAEVYIDSDDPVLAIDDLERARRPGAIGVEVSNFAPAWYSNFRYERREAPALRNDPRPVAAAPSGTVMSWSVSSPFDEKLLAEGERLDAGSLPAEGWSILAAEPTGITNLARLAGTSPEANTVVAGVVLRADEARTVRARFGYSDRVRVYLDGRLLYAGDNGYETRDYRYLGTIGLFDALALPLHAGDNELWFAVSEDFGGWGVLAQIEPDDGVEVVSAVPDDALSPVFGEVAAAAAGEVASARPGELLFSDDFEEGAAGWEISNRDTITVIDSGDAAHGSVLRLAPADAQIGALIRGSERWPAYRIEADVLFPDDRNNYLGLIYHYVASEQRTDMGSIYIKGNGSYIRVNPRRDWNPARMLYEEYRTALTGADAIVIGEWQHFAAEVIGNVCHFYVGDMTVPKVTFDHYEGTTGRVGFKPRVVGGPVWLDNVRVVAIDGPSYTGPPRPVGMDHRPDELVTDWHVLGPLTRISVPVERAADPVPVKVDGDGVERGFEPFATDGRGAVVSGRVVEFLGSATVAYFATRIVVPQGVRAELQLSTIDDLALWNNGVFQGYVYRDTFAWHDVGRNPDHPPTDSLPLEPGVNNVLVRVRGGGYAAGGFFARLAIPAPER